MSGLLRLTARRQTIEAQQGAGLLGSTRVGVLACGSVSGADGTRTREETANVAESQRVGEGRRTLSPGDSPAKSLIAGRANDSRTIEKEGMMGTLGSYLDVSVQVVAELVGELRAHGMG